MNYQKGLGSQKSHIEQSNLEKKKSQINQHLEKQKSTRKLDRHKTAISQHSRTEPQRLMPAGPMAASSQRNARKSFAITDTLITKHADQSHNQHKENTTVHTNTPALEIRSQRSEHQGPIYTGDVNLISIM